MPRGQMFEVVETNKYTKDGEERTSWDRAGMAFERKKGGFNLRLNRVVTIVPGVNELVLMPPRAKGDKRSDDPTDFPPREDQPMEGGGDYPQEDASQP